MTGGPGSVWGVLMSATDEYVNFEVDEEGLWLEGVLALSPDQTEHLKDILVEFYENQFE